MIFLIVSLSYLLTYFLVHKERKNRATILNSIKFSIRYLIVTFLIIMLVYIFTLSKELLSGPCFWLIFLLTVGHFIVDLFENILLTKVFKNNLFNIYITKQISHLLMIFVLVFLVMPNYDFGLIRDSIFKDNYINYKWMVILIYGITFLLITSFSGQLINSLFLTLDSKGQKELIDTVIIEKTVDGKKEKITETILTSNSEISDFGKWIGYCERIITFILVLSQNYSVIAIIIAIKTFARYKQLNQKSFVERYILGTLFSIMIAILFALVYKSIAKIITSLAIMQGTTDLLLLI